MKVNIGKYPSARSKKPRKIEIKIDDWDSWGADHTLALIAAPLLVQLKESKQGSPYVDDEDVPEGLGLRSTEAQTKENEYDLDSNHHERWDYVIGEMIYAMQEIASDLKGEGQFYDHSEVNKTDGVLAQISKVKIDNEGLQQYRNRLQNGCRLFGKYFMCLWS